MVVFHVLANVLMVNTLLISASKSIGNLSTQHLDDYPMGILNPCMNINQHENV